MCDPLPLLFVGLLLLLSQFERRSAVSIANCFFSQEVFRGGDSLSADRLSKRVLLFCSFAAFRLRICIQSFRR
jgi:hypothetical protein